MVIDAPLLFPNTFYLTVM